MKNGKREVTKGIKQPKSEKYQNVRGKNLQLPWNIGSDSLRQTDESKVRKDHRRKTRKLQETKLCSRNLIKGINTRQSSS